MSNPSASVPRFAAVSPALAPADATPPPAAPAPRRPYAAPRLVEQGHWQAMTLLQSTSLSGN